MCFKVTLECHLNLRKFMSFCRSSCSSRVATGGIDFGFGFNRWVTSETRPPKVDPAALLTLPLWRLPPACSLRVHQPVVYKTLACSLNGSLSLFKDTESVITDQGGSQPADGNCARGQGFVIGRVKRQLSAGTMSKETKVRLKSSDDELFEVDEAVAHLSQTVKNMVDDTGTENPIPLPNVNGKVLAKVIEYCKYHVDAHKSSDDKPAVAEDEIKSWDQDFVKKNRATLLDLIRAAYYLNIKNLLELTCQTLAAMMFI